MKSIKEYQQGYLFTKFKQLIRAKAELYKLFFLGVVSQTIYVIISRMGDSQETILSLKDLMTREDLRDNDTFKVYGVVKPGTLSYEPKLECYKFVLSDFERDVSVMYRGDLAFETKEGETLVLTGYFPNIFDKSRMVCVEFMVNHSLETENWDMKKEVRRETYGLKADTK